MMSPGTSLIQREISDLYSSYPGAPSNYSMQMGARTVLGYEQKRGSSTYLIPPVYDLRSEFQSRSSMQQVQPSSSTQPVRALALQRNHKGGVGVRFGREGLDTPFTITDLDNYGPAQMSGLQRGDTILFVDGLIICVYAIDLPGALNEIFQGAFVTQVRVKELVTRQDVKALRNAQQLEHLLRGQPASSVNITVFQGAGALGASAQPASGIGDGYGWRRVDIVRRIDPDNAFSQTAGLGISFQKPIETAAPYTISHIKPGSAAALSGMLAVNDLIHAVGNESVYQMQPDDVKARILGTDGSIATLWISRPGEASRTGTGVEAAASVQSIGLASYQSAPTHPATYRSRPAPPASYQSIYSSADPRVGTLPTVSRPAYVSYAAPALPPVTSLPPSTFPVRDPYLRPYSRAEAASDARTRDAFNDALDTVPVFPARWLDPQPAVNAIFYSVSDPLRQLQASRQSTVVY